LEERSPLGGALLCFEKLAKVCCRIERRRVHSIGSAE